MFEELQEKKQNLLSLASKAVEYGWIPQNKEEGKAISLSEIKEKLEKDTLTIGVIGQMKCGKSTFLNSFVFEDEVLPAATTPMTAALSVITYGETKRIVAEFYTKDEWEEQKILAQRDMSGLSPLEESKIKAAKDLVAVSVKLGSSLENYLGKTQEDTFENLIDYVGADGKYVAITKSVKIYYPKEYLKGVEIVDTPGFNDPIQSREERTKEFLKRADVVLMMLYAGRPFDATDRDIIFNNVKKCGIGKVLVAINKYDIPYGNGETEDQIKEYVKNELRKACQECNDNTLVEILRETEPITLSAEMALLSKLPMSKINSSEILLHAWKRHCETLGISSQQEMKGWSRLDNLVAAIKNVIEKEKGKILFAKPLNAVIAAGRALKLEKENDRVKEKGNVEIFSTPESELEEKEAKLNKAHRRLMKKIEGLGEELDSALRDLVRKGEEQLEDEVDNSCKRMKNILEQWGIFESFDSIKPQLDNEQSQLVERRLKRSVKNLAKEGQTLVERCVEDFLQESSDIVDRFLDDFDLNDFMKSLKCHLRFEVEDGDLFKMSLDNEDESGFLFYVFKILDACTYGVLSTWGNLFSHNEIRSNLESAINNMASDFDAKPYLNTVFERKDYIIDLVKKSYIDELITPLLEQIQEARSKREEREANLQKAQTRLTELEEAIKKLDCQIEEMAILAKSVS